jgi:Fur family ferric uptake transcriptional regulator
LDPSTNPSTGSVGDTPDRAEDRLREYLKTRGLRMTPERLLVLQGVLSREGHFDAEELLRHLQQQDKTVSRATLYRTLEHLTDAGLVIRHHFREGHALFEHAHERKDHDHMVCDRCGKVFEFLSDPLHKLQHEICEAHGFRETRHVHQIFGICRDCQQK